MVLMVESICGQNFAYARNLEEDWQKKLVKLELRDTGEKRRRLIKNWSVPSGCLILLGHLQWRRLRPTLG
jgi:hypothetical protein